MQLRFEIPDSFWSLFRSVNREAYMEALLVINEEYQYSNYFLTKEVCVQVLGDMYAKKQLRLVREENETEFDMLETPSLRMLNWLIRTGWLKKIEDYHTLATNIVIPDYSAVFIDAFERLSSEDMEETEIYIQNVYATLFSFRNDPRVNLNMLRTALINTRRLNKALQDMLHNMDKFFERLLDQRFYGDLLKEHLDGYVEEIVRRKYHILKTSDNFYIYKMDIKKCLRDMRGNEEWIETVRERSRAMGDTKEDVLELLDQIERGFDDIEHRIANMDKEHTKYVRATVTRLNYLLSGETDTKGLVVQLLNRMGDAADYEQIVQKTGAKMNLSLLEIVSEKSLYKRRKGRKDFISQMQPEETTEDLDKEDVLKLNRIQHRYSRRQIEDFIEENIQEGVMDALSLPMREEDEFEKLILAYDLSTRRNSKYMVLEEDVRMVEKNGYRYPALKFVKRQV
ncbi:Wadjet anti-phage system protein JetA family protein [Bariatricus sp. HCP28S3_D3]|uniref:Wadjet anti-phage system protein JetA family protein n=1 Tax=Bariatricus sp. HCP28S3_D3 TaxID=3438901 RepID=UPI003F8A5F25